ncbi:MAG: GAF domain-containing protein [Candidatus Dormibacterales bacterium]
MPMPRAPAHRAQREDLEEVISALRACATEQDIVQVLYGRLRPLFGYEAINLHVLDREGWFHYIAVDEGVLQDSQYRRLADSVVEPFYRAGTTQVMYPTLPPEEAFTSRGPGGARAPRTVIWVPVEHQGSLIGSILYQTYTERRVPRAEISMLEEIHRHLGLLLANAHLNVVTRVQSLRLGALNEIARGLASTLDEREILAALHSSVSRVIPVDRVALALPVGGGGEVRLLTHTMRGFTTRTLHGTGAALQGASEVLRGAGPTLRESPTRGSRARSVMWVPIAEGGEVRGALSLQAADEDAYEQSTVDFAVQVADQAALALRNAWSYSASEARRRRLEVVNGVGRRLISSLDRWSIMRTLREELALHLEFDVFILAALHDGPDGKPLAEGYGYDSGHEQRVPTVPLAVAGPSREAYETKDAVLLKRNPWARSVEAQRPAHESLLATEGAAFFVSRPGRRHRTIARSVIWVPVLHEDRVSALLSVQSYRDGAFDEEDVRLLQDIAAHVSLALDNADHYTAAQVERRRLEALHVIELAVAGAVDEAGIAEGVFNGVSQYLHADVLLLSYLDREGNATGYGTAPAAGFQELPPMPVERTRNFARVLESGHTVQESLDGSQSGAGMVWRDGDDRRVPREVLWVPVFQQGRVVAALSAQRFQGEPFAEVEVQLLESTTPLVGIALRTVRLHRANELALDHSLRIQEVAGLAGHDLSSVVQSVAEQALTMFKATGVCCWAFDAERRVSAARWSGDERAERVLTWAGWSPGKHGARVPQAAVGVAGETSAGGWRMLPLWYADRLVGAIGSIHSPGTVEEPGGPELDFARHSAVAIENARLAAETRGRIRTLEAVAAFTELDPTRPDWTRAEMAGLIERALAPAGTLWLLEGSQLVAASGPKRRVDLPDAGWLAPALRAERAPARLRRLLSELGGLDLLVTPILVEGVLAGLMTAGAQGAPPNETRRLMSVLAGQAGVVLGRLRLVDALARERGMMNAILEHSPVGVMFQDAAGRIVYANPAVERVYEVPAATMVGRSLEGLLAQAGAAPIADVEAEEPGARELRIPGLDRVVHLREVTIPGRGGEPEGILSMHEDVTQQRQVMEAKDLMLRAIGHEVRSPAAAMKNVLASVLQWNDQIDPEQRFELIEEAYEMSDRLLSLVEGQLIISKLETRRFEPNASPVSVELTIAQVMGVLRHRYGERTAAVSVRVDHGLAAAMCEPTHLSQVLTNLIGNALEYTGGPIGVRARSLGGWLEIAVGDRGPGLSADRVGSLFQKPGAAGRNRARGGLGLGLYLCRLVVERSFGGRIWLDGQPGGSTFRFTVPSAATAGRGQHVAAAGG